jgi:hypothetical protein
VREGFRVEKSIFSQACQLRYCSFCSGYSGSFAASMPLAPWL